MLIVFLASVKLLPLDWPTLFAFEIGGSAKRHADPTLGPFNILFFVEINQICVCKWRVKALLLTPTRRKATVELA